MKKFKLIPILLLALIITNKLTAQTQDNKEEAILTYQLAQDEFNKSNYIKALQYLDKVEQLNPNAKVRTSYLKAKCYANTLPESFIYRDKKIRDNFVAGDPYDDCPAKRTRFTNYVHFADLLTNFNADDQIKNNNWKCCNLTIGNGVFNVDFSIYAKCMESINYYRLNGIDEAKKTELLKLKIQIENTDEYNLYESTELYKLGLAEELKGNFSGAKNYYEKSKEYCKFKPLYFNPLLEIKADKCCFYPNFNLDLDIERMGNKIIGFSK